jgi:small subunit ribosomal protein S20
MPHSRSARKRARQADARRLQNRSQRSALRTQIKKTLAAIEAGDADAARAELQKSVCALDRAARKGLVSKNQAARRKSRLARRTAELAQAD